jgi:hypothetical protein
MDLPLTKIVHAMPAHTMADVHFIKMLSALTEIFAAEEDQGRSVTAELKHRDVEWVWRGHPGFVGYPMHGDRNMLLRFDRETSHIVLWK